MIFTYLGQAYAQRSDPKDRLRKIAKLYRIERVHTAKAGVKHYGLDKRLELTTLAKRRSNSRRTSKTTDQFLLRAAQLEARTKVRFIRI